MHRALLLAITVALTASAQPTPQKAPPAPRKKASAPVPTPTPTPKPAAYPILSLRVEGLKNYTQEQVIAVTGLKIGQPARKEDFEKGRDLLVAAGVFESVGYKFVPSTAGEGYDASFQVIEIEQAYPIRFERLPSPDADLTAFLKQLDPLFAPKVPGTQQLIQRYAASLTQFLASKGFSDKVAGRVAPDNTGQLVILFQPATLPPSVAEVVFKGNSVIPQTALQNAIAGVGVGAVYREDRFRLILDSSIRPLYEARGRIRLSFPKITTEPVQDVNGLRVTVEIQEGDSFNLVDVKLDSKARIPESELLKAAAFKPGELANFNEIQEALERIRERCLRDGYLNAKVTTDRKPDDAAKTVALLVHIEPGEQYTFGQVSFQGLDILSEPVIRKIWGMKPGQPFDPNYPDYFLRRLKEDGVFENLGKPRSSVKRNEETHTADVTLIFR